MAFALVVEAIQVRHCALISSPETIAIIFAKVARYMGMPELITVLNIRRPMIVEVFAGTFDAIMESLALCFAKL